MFVISSASERKVTVNGGPKEVKNKKILQLCCRFLRSKKWK